MAITEEDADKQAHYTGLSLEPIDIIRADMSVDEYRGFLKGNIIKYVLRNKGSNAKDAAKAAVYATWLKESYVVNQKEV